jgi:hypothetical protein
MEPNKQKLTGLASIASTLSRGSVGDQVKALQQYLNGLGYDVGKMDSVYGPKVEAAVKQFQLDNGLKGDGIFGPKSLGKANVLGNSSAPAGTPGTGKPADDPSNMYNTDTGVLNTKFKPTTQDELDAFYNASALSHPVFAGNSADDLAYAATTGDFSKLRNESGKPFSNLDQANAMSEAEKALAPGFEAEKRFDTAKTEEDLRAEKSKFDNFLSEERTAFGEDKTTLDQNAADQGVLFSGGRKEKEKRLADAYSSNLAKNLETTTSSIGNIARGYQYDYGDEAAQSPTLSKYYQLGGNVYNPNMARGGATSTGLSSIYSGQGYNFQGKKVNTNKANANVRAASLLSNRGNKLLSTGYQNQL